MPVEKLTTQRAVGFGAASPRIVLENAFAEARRFTQSDRSRNNCFVGAFAEVGAYFGNDLSAQLGAAIKHRHNDATNLKPIVSPGIAHLFHDSYNLNQALQSKILTLNRR